MLRTKWIITNFFDDPALSLAYK